MRHRDRWLSAALGLSLSALFGACELIADFDRGKLDKPDASVSEAGTGGSAGEAGSAEPAPSEVPNGTAGFAGPALDDDAGVDVQVDDDDEEDAGVPPLAGRAATAPVHPIPVPPSPLPRD